MDAVTDDQDCNQRKISGWGRSHFWQQLWRHRCAVNHDATFLLWSAYQQWWTFFKVGSQVHVKKTMEYFI